MEREERRAYILCRQHITEPGERMQVCRDL